MTDYLKYFFNPKHLFNIRPQAMQPRALTILMIIFAVFIILAIVSKLLAIKQKDALIKKGMKQLFNFFLTMGLLGFSYLFFAWQGAILLSARAWLLIGLVVAVIWIFFILKYLIIAVPKKRKAITEKREFEKYIP